MRYLTIILLTLLLSCSKDRQPPTPRIGNQINNTTQPTPPFITIDSIQGKWQIYKEYHYTDTTYYEYYPNNPIVLIFRPTTVEYNIPSSHDPLTVQDSSITSLQINYRLIDIDVSGGWMLVEDMNGSNLTNYTRLNLSLSRLP